MKIADVRQQLNRQNLSEAIRFGIVGVIATALQASVYYLLTKHTGHNLALFFSYAVSLAVNFLLTTCFTFRVKATRRRGVGFLASHAVNFLLQFLVLNFSISIVGIDKQMAIIPVLVVCVPVNFLLIRKVMKESTFL